MERRLTTARDRHFESGLDHMIAGQIALPKLLIEKGIITQQDWNEAVNKVLEEIKNHRERASD